MPGLVIANRRWNLSSDDLPIPAFLESLLRLSWFAVLSVSCWKLYELEMSCSPITRILLAYLVGLQLLQIVILLLNMALIYIALQGTILWDTPRSAANSIILIRAAIFLPEIGWHILGGVWSFLIRQTDFTASSCQFDEAQSIIDTTLKGGIAISIILLLGIFIVFDPAGSIKHCPVNEKVIDAEIGRLFIKPTEKGERRLHRSWRTRIRLFFCCVWFDAGRREAFRDVSELFSQWFYDIDVVPSDLLCALILLRKKQNKLRKMTGNTMEDSNKYHVSPFFDFFSPIVTLQPRLGPVRSTHSWMTPQNALHYMRFAWGSYGWPAFMLTHACTGLCTLWSGLRWFQWKWLGRPSRMTFSPSRSDLRHETVLRGDNCCQCHTAVVRTLARIPDDDLLIVSFKNSLYKIPFYVCYDHDSRSVVIVIRGTLSVNDILTDFTGDAAEFDAPGVPPDSLCHKGVLKCAQYILNQLAEHEILETAFKAQPTYRLVLTGHSLGGGVAITMGVILRSRFPTLRCYAFSPPGGTFTRELCTFTEAFALSVIVGDDVIPRLGVSQLMKLKKQMLTCLIENNLPKHKILTQGLSSFFCRSRSKKQTPRVTRFHTTEHNEKEQKNKENILNRLNECPMIMNSIQSSTNLTDHATSAENDSLSSNNHLEKNRISAVMNAAFGQHNGRLLLPPGRILYLVESNNGFEPCWVTPDHFDHVIISPHMLTDHLPDVCYRALRHICDESFYRL